MNEDFVYIEMNGHEISLVHLDAAERRAVNALQQEAARHPDWDSFSNYWPRVVAALYDTRGMARSTQIQSVPFQIARDLSNRLAIASGQVRNNDYLGDLEQIIRQRFGRVNRAFCNAAGLSEDMLSHVLAGRKDFSMQSLEQALDKIGYALRIQPKPDTHLPAVPKSNGKASTKARTARKTKRKVV